MRALLLILALLCPPALAQEMPPVPTYAEETGSAGLTHSFTGDWEYMVGGGTAVFDCNGDARPDIFMAGGTAPAALFVNDSTAGGPLALRKVASGAEETAVSGAYALDIDSDGIRDLVLLRVGENRVMRGLGDCSFQPANADWGFDGGAEWSTALTATWEADATWPTIAIGNYVKLGEEAFPWGNCADNQLFRPAAGGTGFAPPLALRPGFCALSMLFTDWARTGTPDLRISNDREYYKGGQEQLWRMTPGADPVPYTDKEGWVRLRIWGMGIASSDLDLDGYPEYFMTSMADSKLQSLTPAAKESTPPRPAYAETAFPRGLIAQRPYTGGDVRPSTGWHAQFEDVNNDGLADLFIAKGNVSEMPDFAMDDPNNLLLQRTDGTFAEAGDKAGVASMRPARGAALADLNADGLMDLVVVNRNAPAQIWRNTMAAGGGWAAILPQQAGSNRDAIGAWVELRTGDRIQRREVTVGGGHAGGVLGPQHFGLGAATTAEARVLWPGGVAGDWQAITPGGVTTLLRP